MSNNSNAGFSVFKKTNIPKPTEVEDKRKNIYKWGANNLYPNFLNGLFQESAIQSGIVRSKVHYTVSGGLEYEGADRVKWDLFFKNGNSDYTIEEVYRSACLDFDLYNGFLVLVYWNLANRTISKIEAGDYDKHRKVIGSNNILYSEDWSDSKIEPTTLSPYNPNKKDERVTYLIYEEKPKQVLTKLDNGRVSGSNYPLPPYSGAITSLLTDVKITNYQLNEIANNFSMGTILNLNNGKPKDKETKRLLEKEIKDNATGEDNAGGMMILYNNGKDAESSAININGNDLKDRYLALSQDVRNNILLAHSVTTPILFGVKTEGSLGNATELEVGYNIMNQNYFAGRRKALTDSLMYLASTGVNLQGDIFYKNVELGINLVNKSESEEVGDVAENVNIEELRFSEETKVLDLFKQYGRERSKETVFSRVLKNDFDADVEMTNCLEDFKKQAFEVSKDVEIKVLKLIAEGNDFKSIRQALSLNPSELAGLFKKFKGLDYLDENFKLTNIARGRIAQSDTSVVDIVFSYDLSPTAPPLSIGGKSRDFCTQLVELSKTRVWTREDIESISGFVGYNAFSYRGGWYHNPQTNKNTPWCRHIWKQEIVF